ncbi:MAG: hypothetical protein DMD67_16210 [Gemmatimonadetes bacterium]|nr:MAG: hypothetical protein DMD67_16210 [Gemmatimonadota bacterium]
MSCATSGHSAARTVQVYVRDAGQHVRAERDALRLPHERGEPLDRERLTRGGAGDLGVRRKRIS